MFSQACGKGDRSLLTLVSVWGLGKHFRKDFGVTRSQRCRQRLRADFVRLDTGEAAGWEAACRAVKLLHWCEV